MPLVDFSPALLPKQNEYRPKITVTLYHHILVLIFVCTKKNAHLPLWVTMYDNSDQLWERETIVTLFHRPSCKLSKPWYYMLYWIKTFTFMKFINWTSRFIPNWYLAPGTDQQHLFVPGMARIGCQGIFQDRPLLFQPKNLNEKYKINLGEFS